MRRGSIAFLWLSLLWTNQATAVCATRIALTRAIRQELLRQAIPQRLLQPRERRPTVVSAAAAAALIQAGEYVYMPVGHMAAPALVEALVARAANDATLIDQPVHIVGLTNAASRKLFDREGRVRPFSLFNGANNRDAVSRGQGDFVPVHYSRMPELIRQGRIPVDKAIVLVSPPDARGFVTLGTSTEIGLAALSKAKQVIAEVNPNVPRTHGASKIHISQLDVLVDGHQAIKTIPSEPVGPVEQQIASHIVPLIPDGATLQFGIGGIPNAVASSIVESGRKGFRVWSELISDGVVQLVQSGVVRGPVVYTFAWGSQATLDALHDNRRFFAMPVDVVNSPELLPRLSKLVAINGALEVDLLGNVNAQVLGKEMYSGVGGQRDFMAGATAAPDGRSITALASTAVVGGRRISRIVPRLAEGIATTSMHDVKSVVTEQGVADLDGKTEEQRAQALISIAAPEFRQELTVAFEAQMAARKAAELRRYEAHQQKGQAP